MEPDEWDEPGDAPPSWQVAEAPLTIRWFDEDRIADGLPAEELRRVAQQICGEPVEANKLVHAIVPKSSLLRRGKLTLTQGEQTERLLRLFTQARAAFQDLEDTRAFMRRPHPELSGRRPLDAALTERGGRAVERILDSILYGLPV